MEENPSPTILEGRITGISFSLATRQEICLSSISDCPISHASQLTNPFLGLPLEAGKCEACGTAEPGKCEGHFGYIELPVPIYHPSHISELKRILSLICLKCLKFKNRRMQTKNAGVLERAFASCCDDAAQVTVNEAKSTEGACYLELKLPSRTRPREGFWDFLDRFGYHYGDGVSRPLLSSEVLAILKKIPEATKRKLAGKGCFFQEGYIMQYLPVPPNCLSTPDVSDGMSVMSSDISMTMLKKVLRQVEIIKSSRSGVPNFESLEVEVNDLQAAVAQYLQSRGAKASPNRNTRYGIAKELNDSSSTKAWLEKMKTLFISKGSGFSSRSVITGDPYKGVGEIGIPFEIAQRITFEERVTEYNMKFLQKLVDDKLCLTYRDGQSTYSLREGSKGHTFLKPGQIVHRKIMEGDVIFINRPPTTHKHSLQALSVYIHDDHTFKINPLICGPLSADFDGDCIHIFYPQSPEAKAEVLELFAVEKQLLSSHSGNVNLQLGTDSLLSLKTLFKTYFFTKAQVQQLALFTSNSLPTPSMLKVHRSGPLWTVLELLETSLPRGFDCSGDKFLIRDSKILKLDYSRDVIQSIVNDVISSIFFSKGPKEVLKLFNSLQPMLMENLCCEGFNLSLEDFIVPKNVLRSIEAEIQEVSSLLYHLRSNYNEVIALQLEKHLRVVKGPISEFILRFSSMGNLIDSKSDSAVTRIVQQIGFLGLQILEKGRLYSRTLAEDLSSHFLGNYPFPDKYPSEEFGLVRSCLFHGLDPYQEMVHSIASREVMVRSSRGLTEPGTLFKNLMAILRDVVICYDGTVRNVCSNSIIQFEYGVKTQNLFAAGEPVGVLAATAMSNPAYKAVLDSSPNSNSSWNMMKEILLCGVNFKNVLNDRRVILYLNDCDCGGKYCLENAAYLVKNHLRKVSLKDVALEFLIEYKRQQTTYENAEIDAGLVGHVHLNKVLFLYMNQCSKHITSTSLISLVSHIISEHFLFALILFIFASMYEQTQLKESNISMEEVLTKCEDTLNSFRKKKKIGQFFKKIALSCSECTFQQSSESKWTPCLKFFWQDTSDIHLEKTAHIFADRICPVLLNTIIKGDPRVREANITWISPETTAWIRNPSKDTKGELAIDVVLEKEAVKKSGDAWRTVMDSCLPIIHLIDTRRSIPYAIKQVEGLLGISCAFEQAVQRLSTSVSMVSKGMLKEHLLLLANSMTCAGNLVGFNQAGIKALSKTLNFQVPFSEATLYTPKRCFEKAAEKCHSDSLSSIVAACSWGKPVAVGTGSRFDILWDTREVEMNQKDGIDVYNFLHLVRGGSEEEADSAGLAGEVDSFEMEDNFMEMGSPEHNSGSTKPVFEDGLDLDLDEMDDNQTSKSSWEKGPEVGAASGGWEGVVKTTAATEGGWGEAKSDKDQPVGGAWGGWGKKDVQADASGSWGAKTQKDVEPSGSWGAKAQKDVEPSGSWGAKAQKDVEPSGSWGAKAQKDVEPSGSWGAKAQKDVAVWIVGSEGPKRR
ncbi:Aspartate decarboxylase-like domain-containing protein [Cynara cardunculus var. scolymus]|uniref:DNA-directed RNA polymerase subunit n=1 Tax=Cynara cardunculus var. scolymus TaxID=59895 RepID=A0A103XCC3_CYNCS|nr:Aspartate decarboxylase-like domain-containing protein [Cynara cardunculus var. scolymus]